MDGGFKGGTHAQAQTYVCIYKRSLWRTLTARAASNGESVVNGDSCAECVILHSDRCFLRFSCIILVVVGGGFHSKMNKESSHFREEVTKPSL